MNSWAYYSETVQDVDLEDMATVRAWVSRHACTCQSCETECPGEPTFAKLWPSVEYGPVHWALVCEECIPHEVSGDGEWTYFYLDLAELLVVGITRWGVMRIGAPKASPPFPP